MRANAEVREAVNSPRPDFFATQAQRDHEHPRAVRRPHARRGREARKNGHRTRALKPIERESFQRGKDFLPRHSRYDYVPITDRKDYSWPEGKRRAFCITPHRVLCLRRWLAQTTPRPASPDAAGTILARLRNRVGIWRLFDLVEELKLRRSRTTPTACSTTTRRRSSRESVQEATRSSPWRTSENLSGLWDPTRTHHSRGHRDFCPHTRRSAPRVDGCRRLRDLGDTRPSEGGRYAYSWTGLATTSRSGCERAQGRSCRYPTRSSQRSPAIVHRKHSAREFCDMLVTSSTRCRRRLAEHTVVYKCWSTRCRVP